MMSRVVLAAFCALAVPVGAAGSPISNERQLIFEGARSGEGYFSADGEMMIFQSEREDGNPFFQIYLLDFATGDVERLSPGIGKTTCGWIHPDGDRAIYASTQFDPQAPAKMQAELDIRASGQTRRYSWDYDPSFDIVETPLDGATYRRLAPAQGYDAEGAYSPDGSRIVFASNRHAYSGPLDGEAAARLETDPAFFLDIYVMNADGTGLRRLTTEPGYDGGPFWSADGGKITWRRFAEDGASAEIYTMNADGTGQTRLTYLGVVSWAPFFHPSGEYLVFSSNLEGFSNFELYLVDSGGRKAPVRVTEREGFDGLPSFSPDGSTISWTSNATRDRNSQIFIGAWDHEAARAMLAAAPDRQAEAPRLRGTVPEIRVADLRRHVEALTADEMAGRLTGTEGERLATDYVAGVFDALDLAPAGDDATMFQSFDFPAGVDLGEGNALRLAVAGESWSPRIGEDWLPLAFSRTVEAADAAEAPVAFGGYGIVAPGDGESGALDSYAGLDVAGKWVLLWRDMPFDLPPDARVALSRFADPRYKASVAKARGAAGVIFAPPPSQMAGNAAGEALPRLSFEAISGTAGLPVVAISDDNGQRMLAVLGAELDGVVEAADAGQPVARELPGVSAEATIALEIERRRGRNVIARLDLDGRSDGLPPLVIGAHVDHLGRGETSGSLARDGERGEIHPGADDNASGVAALLEIAQGMVADHAAGRLQGSRDVVFAAWSGEELGLLGASHYVETAAERAGADDLADLVSAYLNMDMVGRLDDRLMLSGIGSSDGWRREIERRNAVIGLPIAVLEDSYLPTDATAFYLASVPILSAFTGAHEDYHRPSDTADRLNYEGLRDVARFMGLVARSLATSPEELAYRQQQEPEGRGGRRMSGVYLGTIPDYAAEGEAGVPLSGVVKGGPAEAAGVMGGDVLVELAGQDLANIYDYVRVLNGLRPGETVGIELMRDGQAVELQITPRLRN